MVLCRPSGARSDGPDDAAQRAHPALLLRIARACPASRHQTAPNRRVTAIFDNISATPTIFVAPALLENTSRQFIWQRRAGHRSIPQVLTWGMRDDFGIEPFD